MKNITSNKHTPLPLKSQFTIKKIQYLAKKGPNPPFLSRKVSYQYFILFFSGYSSMKRKAHPFTPKIWFVPVENEKKKSTKTKKMRGWVTKKFTLVSKIMISFRLRNGWSDNHKNNKAQDRQAPDIDGSPSHLLFTILSMLNWMLHCFRDREWGSTYKLKKNLWFLGFLVNLKPTKLQMDRCDVNQSKRVCSSILQFLLSNPLCISKNK